MSPHMSGNNTCTCVEIIPLVDNSSHVCRAIDRILPPMLPWCPMGVQTQTFLWISGNHLVYLIWIEISEFGIQKRCDWREEEGEQWLTVWLASVSATYQNKLSATNHSASESWLQKVLAGAASLPAIRLELICTLYQDKQSRAILWRSRAIFDVHVQLFNSHGLFLCLSAIFWHSRVVFQRN